MSKDIKTLVQSDQVKKRFYDLLGKRTNQFLVTIINVVNQNKLLQDADPNSILMAAATAASLDLPIDNNLGFAYIVPYKNKGEVKAQFQIGAKGFVQLAIRSGQFKFIHVSEVKEGEIIFHNRLTGQIEFKWIEDREKLKTIGYVSYFQLLNGFESTYYKTVEELHGHGKKYSKSYETGNWKTDFDSMARKTVIKMNLSKNAPLSIEMQTAITADQAEVTDEGFNYIDNAPVSPHELAEQKEFDRTKTFIENAESVEQLQQVESHLTNDELVELYHEKLATL